MRKWGGGSAQCCVTVSSSLHQIFDFYPYSLWIGGGDTFFVLLKPFPFRVQGHGLPCRGKYNVYPTPSLNIFFFLIQGHGLSFCMMLGAGCWVCLLHLVLLFQLWHVSAVEGWTLLGFVRQQKPPVKLQIIGSVLYGYSIKVYKTLEVSGYFFLPVRDTTICDLWQRCWVWENVLLCKSRKGFL